MLIRVALAPDDPFSLELTIKFASTEVFYDEKEFIESLEEARFCPDTRTWRVSILAIDQIWKKLGLEFGDWHLLPWEYGLTDPPAELPSVVPDDYELVRFSGDDRPFQTEGASFLYQRGRAILGDDVGLGKTSSAIRAMLKGMINGSIQKVLVITRASLKSQWAEELEDKAGIQATVIQGSPDRRRKLWASAAPVVVVNYDLLIRPGDLESMTAFRPDAIIFDEFHYLKNRQAQRTRAALRLVRSTPYVWGLTATLTSGKLEEIWSLFQFIAPSLLGKISYFNRIYCIPTFVKTDYGMRFRGFRNYKNKRILAALTRPYILARKTEDVHGQVPEVLEIPHKVDPSPGQQKLFKLLEERMEELEKQYRTAPDHQAQLIENQRQATLTFMQMAADDPALLRTSDSWMARKFARGIEPGSPKLDELEELARNWASAGHSFLIFTEYVGMVEAIKGRMHRIQVYLEDREDPVPLEVWSITGEMSEKQRDEIKQAFQSCETPACLVLDRAGQEGLNLQKASIVCLFEPPWNPQDVRQRIGRARRLSSQHDVIRLYTLITRNSIDEKILGLHKKRRETIEEVS